MSVISKNKKIIKKIPNNHNTNSHTYKELNFLNHIHKKNPRIIDFMLKYSNSGEGSNFDNISLRKLLTSISGVDFPFNIRAAKVRIDQLLTMYYNQKIFNLVESIDHICHEISCYMLLFIDTAVFKELLGVFNPYAYALKTKYEVKAAYKNEESKKMHSDIITTISNTNSINISQISVLENHFEIFDKYFIDEIHQLRESANIFPKNNSKHLKMLIERDELLVQINNVKYRIDSENSKDIIISYDLTKKLMILQQEEFELAKKINTFKQKMENDAEVIISKYLILSKNLINESTKINNKGIVVNVSK